MCKVLEVSSSVQSTPPKLPPRRLLRYTYHLCERCGLELDPRSRYFCPSCRLKARAANRRHVQQLIAKGKCRSCAATREQLDKTLCDSCLQELRDNHKRRKQARIDAGLCVLCGKVNVQVAGGRYLRCLGCRDKEAAQQRAGRLRKRGRASTNR